MCPLAFKVLSSPRGEGVDSIRNGVHLMRTPIQHLHVKMWINSEPGPLTAAVNKTSPGVFRGPLVSNLSILPRLPMADMTERSQGLATIHHLQWLLMSTNIRDL